MNSAQLLPDVRTLRQSFPEVPYDRKAGPKKYLEAVQKEARLKDGDGFVSKETALALDRLKGPATDRSARSAFHTAVAVADVRATQSLVQALDGPTRPYDPAALKPNAKPILEQLERQLSVRGKALAMMATLFSKKPPASAVDDGVRVEAYYNLHQHTPSVRAGGIVQDHMPAVAVSKPDLVVQAGGRATVLREQSKNVHAFLRGAHQPSLDPDALEGLVPVRVKYDPYRFASFVTADTEQPVDKAEHAAFVDNQGTTVVVAWLTPEDLESVRAADRPTPFQPETFDTRILSVEAEGPKALKMRFASPPGSKPKPGQFVWLELPGLKPTPFGISGSAPGEVEVTVAAHGATARALMDAPVGTELKMSQPKGTAFPAESDGSPLYLVGGGSGVAPLKAAATAHGGADVLFAGFGKPEDVLFVDGLNDLARDVRLHVRRTGGSAKQPGATDALQEAQLDPKGRAFVVGPQGFMATAVQTLQAKGLDPSRIFVSLNSYGSDGNVEGPVFSVDHPQVRSRLGQG